MDLIYITAADGTPTRMGFLKHYEADFEIGSTAEANNDFEIKMEIPEREDLLFIENEISTRVFVEGTEWGGEITGTIFDLEDGTVTYTGRTWRGTFDQEIIEPPAGEDYRIVSGNISEILRGLPIRPYMAVQDCGYSIGSLQLDRYIRTREGISAIFQKADADLRLRLVYELYDGYEGHVLVYVEPKANLTDQIEVSQDYNDKIHLRITRDGNTPKRMICLGRGELKDREVLNLYADDDWNISTTEQGAAFPVEIYDYGSSEDLEADGRKKFAEAIGNHRQIEVSISDLDIELGDIISARDHITGEQIEAEISGIVWKHSDYGDYSSESFEYKTKVRL